MRIIEVIVSPQGETTVQTRGFVGAECLLATKWLEQTIGITVSDVKTADFHQQAVTEQQIQQQ